MRHSHKLLILIAILFSQFLEAHPMGNFSISHYSRLEYTKDGILLKHIIDMAEIPSYQQMEFLNTDHNSKISADEKIRYAERISHQLLPNLKVRMNQMNLTFKIKNSRLEIRPGAGDLPTFVTYCTYFAEVPASIISNSNTLEFADQNFPERSGWREIVINRVGGFASLNLPAGSYTERSEGLSQYPTDPSTAMPQEMKLNFKFGNPLLATQQQVSSSDVQNGSHENVRPGTLRNDKLAKLITTKELTSEVIFISIIIAFFLGAMHALSPGHGKAIVAGYLVGSRGTAFHAMFLGAVVTLTHTIGVFALGLITLFGSKYILPDTLYPWLGFLSGLSIVIIGSRLFYKRFKMMKSNGTPYHHHHHDHDHSHDHHGHHDHHNEDHYDHHHDHGHSHLPVDPETGKITWRSLLSVGISGGALPCPSALVVLLSAISLHRVGFGLILIISFSLGLAAVLTSIGLLLLYASRWSQKFQPRGSLRYDLPVISSLVITVLGCIIAVQSILQI
jgi:nickel/cobalt transporter (NicO) family protein